MKCDTKNETFQVIPNYFIKQFLPFGQLLGGRDLPTSCLPEQANSGSTTTNTHQATSELTDNIIIIWRAWQPKRHNNNNSCMSSVKKLFYWRAAEKITTTIAAMAIMVVANTNNNNNNQGRSWKYNWVRDAFRGHLSQATFVTWQQLVQAVKSSLTAGIFKC